MTRQDEQPIPRSPIIHHPAWYAIVRLVMGILIIDLILAWTAVTLGFAISVFTAVFEHDFAHHALFMYLFLPPFIVLFGILCGNELIELLKDVVQPVPMQFFRNGIQVLTGSQERAHLAGGLVVMLGALCASVPLLAAAVESECEPTVIWAYVVVGGVRWIVVCLFLQFGLKILLWRRFGDMKRVQKRLRSFDSESMHEYSTLESQVSPVCEPSRESWKRPASILCVSTVLFAMYCALIIKVPLPFFFRLIVYVGSMITFVFVVGQLLIMLGSDISFFKASSYGFLAIITILALFGKQSHVMNTEYVTPDQVAMALEPPPVEYGNVFVPPAHHQRYHLPTTNDNMYPLCLMRWGTMKTEHHRLTALDLNVFATAIYYDKKEDAMSVVLNATTGTDLAGGIQLDVSSRSPHEAGFYGVFKIPKAKACVMAIRGTKYAADALTDANLWAGIKTVQIFDRAVSLLSTFPTELFQYLILKAGANWFGEKEIYEYLSDVALQHKRRCGPDYQFVVTGHSLGGGLGQIVAAAAGVPALVWSPVGTLYSSARFGIKRRDVFKNVVAVSPRSDVVPKIDFQDGFNQRIECDGGLLPCHSVRRSGCEVFKTCGDPRGRNMEQNCRMAIPGWTGT
eukprot:TRINITY_DN29050_c0_g1_i1.p1 TRINITY_DN29050_c0_g1~~TRINITY_DN29050_c0_g1_i1.p1  ORF type:complete len:625 (+),score=47.11 TRINITY_DN29050_c0_g1_i1:59-1933(+)